MGNLAGTVNLDSIGVPHTWDAWGRNTSTTWDAMDALGWKGLQPETGAGLIYMRARWYDPTLGRFISEDPAGLAGGINPYVFAGDDPINQSDPSGLLTQDPDLAQQLCAINGGTYGEFSDRSVCIAHTLQTVRVTGVQDPLFGGPEPADPTPSVIFAQFANMSGPKQISTDPKAAWARCTEQAVPGNAVTLGLDVGAIAVGVFLPEEDMAQAAVKLGAEGGLAVVSFAHSAVHNDGAGALAAIAGFQMASVSQLGHLIPYAGLGISLATFGNDVRKAHADYKSCVAGH
jgi:RHS repeat-associated protein